MIYKDHEESREAGVTYHLAVQEVWKRQEDRDNYVPEEYEADGFLHCTNGLDELVQVGNRYYRGDDRERIVLVLDVSKIESPVRYDDPNEIFPHIYGPLNTSAVVGVLAVDRAGDGEYLGFSPLQ